MFKKIIFFNLIFLIFSKLLFANVEINARTAILQDFLSGEILYEEPDRSIYPTSIPR